MCATPLVQTSLAIIVIFQKVHDHHVYRVAKTDLLDLLHQNYWCRQSSNLGNHEQNKKTTRIHIG